MYQEAREAAGLTQRRAAERLYIAIRTLRAYELDDVTPGPEIALRMSRVYRQPELMMRYCQRECAIGQEYSFEPKIVNLEHGFLRLLKEFRDVEVRLDRETARVINGEIDAATLKELLELEHAIETLKLCCTKGHDLAALVREHNDRQKEKDRFQAVMR